MKVFEGIRRIIFLGYFLMHIPITLLIDAQASYFNPIPYPQPLLNLMDWYSKTLKDVHFDRNEYEVWFQCLITIELYLQMPYFVISSWMLLRTKYQTKTDIKGHFYPEWFRFVSLIYCSQALTAILLILIYIYVN